MTLSRDRKKKEKPDIVFNCNKCGAQLFVEVADLKKIFKTDCPNCGEEAHENYTISRFGDFSKEHPDL